VAGKNNTIWETRQGGKEGGQESAGDNADYKDLVGETDLLRELKFKTKMEKRNLPRQQDAYQQLNSLPMGDLGTNVAEATFTAVKPREWMVAKERVVGKGRNQRLGEMSGVTTMGGLGWNK